MDYVMYFSLAVVRELWGGFVGVLTVYRFQNVFCVAEQEEADKSIMAAAGIFFLVGDAVAEKVVHQHCKSKTTRCCFYTFVRLERTKDNVLIRRILSQSGYYKNTFTALIQ